MVEDSLTFAATFLVAPIFGAWFLGFVALFMARRFLLFFRGLSK